VAENDSFAVEEDRKSQFFYSKSINQNFLHERIENQLFHNQGGKLRWKIKHFLQDRVKNPRFAIGER
jgi:hypothetical protein